MWTNTLALILRLGLASLLTCTTLLIPVATFAQERAAGETLSPRTTALQRTGIVAVTGTSGALLRDTPAGSVTQLLPLAQTLTAVGRNAVSDWIFVALDDESTGWIAAEELVVFGTDRLPVVELVGNGTVDSGTVVGGTGDSGTVDSGTVDGETAAVGIVSSDTTTATVVTGQVTLRDSRLNIRAGPAMGYPIVGKAQPAAVLTLLGRTETGDWVQVALDAANRDSAADRLGWVAGRYLTTSELMALPVVETASTAPALPTAEPEPAQPAAETEPAPPATVAAPVPTANGQAQGSSATGLAGTLVFQSSPGGMIYAYNLSTGQLWDLTNGFDPAISPDGRTVAFVREGGENGVYLINIDGSNERAIFTGRTRLSSPKWSPDGNWILFTRSDEYSECINFGRGGCLDVDALPPGLPTDDLERSKDYKYNLAAVDTNGDHYHDIAALESARVADWNAAGIVYQSSAGLQITADKPDAENRLLLFIPLQPPHEDPDWQPNGGKVAFVEHHGSHYEIFTMNPDGSDMTPLTRPVTTLVDEMPNNLAPAWSPDGQHIVFLSNRDEGNEAGAWRIWVMDADGSNQGPLPIDVTINYSYGNEQAVSWGP